MQEGLTSRFADPAQVTSSGFAVCIIFRKLHNLVSQPMGQERPDSPDTRTSEQPQLPVTGLAPQELQHLLRVGTGQPFSFSHNVTPCPQSASLPSSPHMVAPPGSWQ